MRYEPKVKVIVAGEPEFILSSTGDDNSYSIRKHSAGKVCKVQKPSISPATSVAASQEKVANVKQEAKQTTRSLVFECFNFF